MISLLKLKFDLFNRRALFLSADKLAVYHWYRGKLGSSYLFDTDREGQKNFIRYIRETPNSPVYIMVDVIEEEFRVDTIPHVFGADRDAVIQRKQSRLFREASYFHTLFQGREEEGRRDDKILFMALTGQDIIKPWVEILEQHKVPLAGIISLPLLIQSFLKYLPKPSEHMLVVSMQSISGLRQTFFQQQQLKISRLAKLPRYGTASYAPRIFDEVDKIRRYLNSLRLISAEHPLDIYFLANRELLEELKQSQENSAMVRHHLLDIDELASEMEIEKKQITPFSDQIYAYHLLSSALPNAYATVREMRYNKLRKFRHAMNAASLLLVLTGSIYGGFNFMDAITFSQQSESAKNKTQFYTQRYNMARERLPETPVQPAEIKVAVDMLGTLEKYKSTPVEMMRYLGHSLMDFPEIQLQQIEWISSLDPNAKLESGENSNSNLNIDAESKADYYQIATINAQLVPFDGNYRAAIAMVNKFAEVLRQDDLTYDVTILTFPLDVSSEGNLSGDVKKIDKKAEFSLRAVIGIHNGKTG